MQLINPDYEESEDDPGISELSFDSVFCGLCLINQAVWLDLFFEDDLEFLDRRKRELSRIKKLITSKEYSIVTQHPRGDPTAPILEFPCTYYDFAYFIRWAKETGFLADDIDLSSEVKNILKEVFREQTQDKNSLSLTFDYPPEENISSEQKHEVIRALSKKGGEESNAKRYPWKAEIAKVARQRWQEEDIAHNKLADWLIQEYKNPDGRHPFSGTLDGICEGNERKAILKLLKKVAKESEFSDRNLIKNQF